MAQAERLLVTRCSWFVWNENIYEVFVNSTRLICALKTSTSKQVSVAVKDFLWKVIFTDVCYSRLSVARLQKGKVAIAHASISGGRCKYMIFNRRTWNDFKRCNFYRINRLCSPTCVIHNVGFVYCVRQDKFFLQFIKLGGI